MPARLLRHGRTFGRTLAGSVVALALIASVGCGAEPDTLIERADDVPTGSEPEEKVEPSPSPTFVVEDEPYVQVALEYYEAFNKANDAGDADELRDLSTPDCEACRLTADRLEKLYADGGHIEGGDMRRLPDVDIESAVDGGSASVTVVYEYLKETVVEKAGAKSKSFPTELTEEQFTLEEVGGAWKISNLVSEEYKD